MEERLVMRVDRCSWKKCIRGGGIVYHVRFAERIFVLLSVLLLLLTDAADSAVSNNNTTSFFGGIYDKTGGSVNNSDFSTNNNNATAHVVNGVKVVFGKYPAFAYADNGYCAATLIWKDIVVTAAHCLEGLNYDNAFVYIGGTKMDGSNAPEAISIRRRIQHPGYRTNAKQGNDIMIMVLDTPSTAPPVTWNSDPFIPAERDAVVVIGHGQTATADCSYDLRETTLTVMNTQTCAEAHDQPYIFFAHKVICTSAITKSACHGDSGGPLWYTFPNNNTKLLVGITSFGSPDCIDPDIPNGFTRISTYSDWIWEQICTMSSSPPTRNGKCNKQNGSGQPSSSEPCPNSERCVVLSLFPGYKIHSTLINTCVEKCAPLSSSNNTLQAGWKCGKCSTK